MCHILLIHMPEFSPINYADNLVSTENFATLNHLEHKGLFSIVRVPNLKTMIHCKLLMKQRTFI